MFPNQNEEEKCRRRKIIGYVARGNNDFCEQIKNEENNHISRSIIGTSLK